MADKPIGGLARAPDLYDDSLLPMEQQGEAMSITGAQVKKFARQGVEDYVEAALGAAERAENAVAGIEASVEAAETARTGAEDAQEGAERARKAIEDLEAESITLEPGAPASVEKTADENHVKLVFGIPTGQTGPRGPAGSSIDKIERTAGTGAAGTVDTYTVFLTDGSTHTFQVYNGADGDGAGDMTARVYDPRGIMQDIFAYAENCAESARSYADTLLPVIHELSLTPEGWENCVQTVNVPGVVEDEKAQLIHIQPVDMALWQEYGLSCTGQGRDTLTFTARDRPAGAIRLLAAVQAAKGVKTT